MKENDQAVLHFLSTTAGKTKWNIVGLALLQAVLGGCSVSFALLLRGIIDAAVAGSHAQFYQNVGFLAGLICFQLLCRFLGRMLEETTRVQLENRLKHHLFAQLLHRDFAAVTAVHTGEWSTRLTSDTVLVANAMTQILPGATGMAIKLTGALVAILAIEPRFFWLLFPGGAAIILLSASFRKVTKRLHKQVQEQDGRLRVFLSDMLGSLLVVCSYGVQAAVTAEADDRLEAYRHSRMKRARFSTLCNMGFGALFNAAYLLGAAMCGAGILDGSMSYGGFIAIWQLIGQVQSPVANISGFLPRYYAMLASAERLMDVERLPEQTSVGLSLTRMRRCYAQELSAFGLSHASFTYQPPVMDLSGQGNAAPPQPVVLRDVTLEITKGSYVAFTGPSGCGKSTILKLLLCLYLPDAGERYLIMGGKRQPLDAAWQKLFAYVPQGNHLMSGSIRQIVAFGDRDAADDDARLWNALRIACAADFVQELTQGADTILGERGLGLSEGQMQRLAIARAIFADHPILLLDECTSALDADTEKQVLQNMRAMTDKTVLIVTHRPAALEICDTVVCFDETGCTVRRSRSEQAGTTPGRSSAAP